MDDQPTALITGAGRGIGYCTAKHLLDSGYQIAVLDTDKTALEHLLQACEGQPLLTMHGDVSNETSVREAIERVMATFGCLDAVINNAAIAINRPISELSLDEWNQVLGVNLNGAFLTAKYASPHLQRQRGSIVNIGSTRALMSEPDTEAYSASKGAIVSLTHALAISLGPAVRVNCISPGWIDVTPYQHDRKPEVLDQSDHDQHPCGRVGKPEDIASLIEYLISPKAGFITGQNYIVDGGMTRKMIYAE